MKATDEHIDRLQAGGVIDLHFDLPLGLHLRAEESDIIARDFLPQFEAGNIGLLGLALYVEDKDVPNRAWEVASDQVRRLLAEIRDVPRLALCRTFEEIIAARARDQIALLLTMEGVEPLGTDLQLLHTFYDLGLRALSPTHARPNEAGAGGVFAASGSPATGLTDFGRDLVRECERLGIILDLAHINPAGFEEIASLTTRPLIVSHTNARHFYDIERNISDEQIKMIGERGGVIGVNAILVSADREKATLDHYVDHIEHIAGLIGIEGVAIGFDFCEFLWDLMPAAKREALEAKLTKPHFLPDLTHHGQARNLTRKLIERGFSDEQIALLLRENWMRVLRELL